MEECMLNKIKCGSPQYKIYKSGLSLFEAEVAESETCLFRVPVGLSLGHLDTVLGPW